MDVTYQEQLVSGWKNSQLDLSYEVWKKHMKDHYKSILKTQLPNLTKNISLDGLFTHLTSKRIFDRRLIETFQQQQGRYAQVSAILNALETKPFEVFVRFCQALAETNQIHIIRDYLTPDGLGTPIKQVGQVEDPENILGIEIRPIEEEEKVATTVNRKNSRTLVDFDWRNLIRINFPRLTDEIELADGDFMSALVSRGVISEANQDFYTSIKGRSNRVEALLNHLATVRPDEDFLEFCDVLRTTNQAHIVEKYLTKDSQQHVSSASQSKHDSSSETASGQKPVNQIPQCVMENARHLFEDDGWKMVLINKRSRIIDQIDTSSGLIGRLLSLGVMNQSTAEQCQEEIDDNCRAEMLIDYMHRRTSKDFKLLCQALYDDGQNSLVVDTLLKRTNVNLSDGVS